jgi:hypothetical protein
VARDEPQVSVRGLLEQDILGPFLGIAGENRVTIWIRSSTRKRRKEVSAILGPMHTKQGS